MPLKPVTGNFHTSGPDKRKPSPIWVEHKCLDHYRLAVYLHLS
jgi:hypothetical protein